MGEMNGKIIVIAMFEIVVNSQNSLSFVFFLDFDCRWRIFVRHFDTFVFFLMGRKLKKPHLRVDEHPANKNDP
jgi:hypothetical protein